MVLVIQGKRKLTLDGFLKLNSQLKLEGKYKKFFNPEKLPARSAFAGSGLALGAKLEIECMAIKKN